MQKIVQTDTVGTGLSSAYFYHSFLGLMFPRDRSTCYTTLLNKWCICPCGRMLPTELIFLMGLQEDDLLTFLSFSFLGELVISILDVL